MNPRIRKVLPWVLYPVFYLICFLIFFYFTFPFEHLRDRIIVAFAEDQRKSGGESRLEIDRISSYWFSGVDARGVRLISAPSIKQDGTIEPPSRFEIDRAIGRVALLPLLIGRVTINFSADMLGGEIVGSTRKSGDDRTIKLEMDGLDVGDVGPLVQMVGLPLSGRLGGTFDLALPEGKLSKATGAIDLVIRDLSVGDGKAKIRDAIALPRMVVGDLEMACDIAEGRLTITKFAAAGSDLDFSADGKLTLRDRFAESQADVYLRFKFSDRYKAKDDKTKALFGDPGSKAPALFEIADPKIRQSKRPDGFYSWRAWGLFRSLRFDPAPAGGTGSRGKPASPGGVRGFTR